MKRHRLAITTAVLAAIIAFIVWVPLPYHVDAPVTIEPRNADVVFASVPCVLKSVNVKPGQKVNKGHIIAELESIPLRLAIKRLEQERARYVGRRDSLERLRRFDDRVAGQILEMDELVKGLDEQLSRRRVEEVGLTVRAPRDGTIMLPAYKKDSSQAGELPGWSGYLLDGKNAGATLAPDDQICIVGDPEQLEAIAVIDQSYIDLVKDGSGGLDQAHQISVMLDANPGTRYKSVVERISEPNLQYSPINISSQAGGSLGTVSDASGGLKPISTSYSAHVDLKDYYGDEILQKGLRGRAKIYTGWQSIGSRLYRYATRTFNFEL